MTAYCVVAVESVGRQVPIAFLERIKEDFVKRYGGGKAATAAANSLDREFGYVAAPFCPSPTRTTTSPPSLLDSASDPSRSSGPN